MAPRTRFALSFVLVTLTGAGALLAQEALPRLTLDPDATTVSGLSSGAFMAVQIQVAHSAKIAGAGIVAGGPYDCADDLLWRALRVCMDPLFVEADAGRSVDAINEFASVGRIDSPDGIAGDRIYLFHGQADDTVARASMDALRESYARLNVPEGNIIYETGVNAGHGFVTEAGTLACDITRPDFLIDCDVDQAGDILRHLYPGITGPGMAVPDNLRAFDQSAFLNGADGMDEIAFVYVPQACRDGEMCRLHIALHGCKQGHERIGEDYARLTGYNRWAEANRIVVLYPQAMTLPANWLDWIGRNPNGCWDWWGYADDDYQTRSAPQIAAIGAMAAALGVDLSE